ncbi:RNase A-like domain-containing protein [Streptomyces sp. NPDC006743]|uniref:RNase A-like domain-containing protein n=1 Tax=Streptomyces sp. NPDC006743 TaxID=3154480 RepID=UPI003452E15D
MSVADKARKVVQDLTGMWWPAADVDGLRDAAKAWRDFADDVEDVTAAVNKAARSLIENNKGEAISAFEDPFWRRYYHDKHGWLKDLSDGAHDMAKALDAYADAVHAAKKKLEHELEIVGATLVGGTLLAVFTAGLSEGAAVAAAATVTEVAAGLGVTVTAEVASIAGTTLATAALAGIESVTVDLAVAQPLSIALGEKKGLSLDEAREAGVYGALLGGALGGGGAAVRAADREGGWTELLGGVRLPGLSPEFALPGGVTASADDLGLLMKGDGEPNAWPRSKRKGAVKPRYRADLAGDEGKGTAKSHSHTLEKHVEKTDRELRARLRAEKRITGSSSFVSPEAAQNLTDRAIIQRQHEVRRWLENTRKPELTFRVDFGDEVTGRSLSREDFIRGTGPHNVHKVFLLLRRDPDMPSGYRIHTSYPTS